MQHTDYMRALEKRLEWLRWSRTDEARYIIREDRSAQVALPMYQTALESGDTFIMGQRFCELVDYARATIPDELEFDPNWMLAKEGFLWLEQPFQLPRLDPKLNVPEEFHNRKLVARAVAWFHPTYIRDPLGTIVVHPKRRQLTPESIQFIVFQSMQDIDIHLPGFNMWSYFLVNPGDKVIERTHEFEGAVHRDTRTENPLAGSYLPGYESDMLHEVRWVYTAMHLMSQRLTVTRTEHPNRAYRRRREKERRPPEIPQLVRVVTLRRLEEERKRNPHATEPVDWQWQWRVKGHGRWQYYASTQEHRYIWIEDYIKGPEDKPLKPPQLTIYNAQR